MNIDSSFRNALRSAWRCNAISDFTIPFPKPKSTCLWSCTT